MSIESVTKKVKVLTKLPDEALKQVIRNIYDEDPYSANRIKDAFIQVSQEPIGG